MKSQGAAPHQLTWRQPATEGSLPWVGRWPQCGLLRAQAPSCAAACKQPFSLYMRLGKRTGFTFSFGNHDSPQDTLILEEEEDKEKEGNRKRKADHFRRWHPGATSFPLASTSDSSLLWRSGFFFLFFLPCSFSFFELGSYYGIQTGLNLTSAYFSLPSTVKTGTSHHPAMELFSF